jgi:hypothetical protein
LKSKNNELKKNRKEVAEDELKNGKSQKGKMEKLVYLSEMKSLQLEVENFKLKQIVEKTQLK